MTTVAYKDGVMCSDSLVTSGRMITGTTKKIFYNQNIVLATAGAADDRELIQWLLKTVKSPKSLPTIPELHEFAAERGADYYTIIVFRRSCRLFFGSVDTSLDKNYLFEMGTEDYLAIGSGADLAMGAMAAGCDAYDAVRAAIKHDACSGGEIVEVVI